MFCLLPGTSTESWGKSVQGLSRAFSLGSQVRSDVTSGSPEPWNRPCKSNSDMGCHFQEIKYPWLISSTCEYKDPNMANLKKEEEILRIFLHFLISERCLAFFRCLTFLQTLSPRELGAYHCVRKRKYREFYLFSEVFI